MLATTIRLAPRKPVASVSHNCVLTCLFSSDETKPQFCCLQRTEVLARPAAQLNLTRLARAGLAAAATTTGSSSIWLSSSLSLCSPDSVSVSGDSWSLRPQPEQNHQCLLTFLLQSTLCRQCGHHRGRVWTNGRAAALYMSKNKWCAPRSQNCKVSMQGPPFGIPCLKLKKVANW